MVGAILMTKHFSYILWGVGLWGVTIQTIGEQKLRLPFGQQLHVFFSEATKHQKETLAGLGPCVGVILDQVFLFFFDHAPIQHQLRRYFQTFMSVAPNSLEAYSIHWGLHKPCTSRKIIITILLKDLY